MDAYKSALAAGNQAWSRGQIAAAAAGFAEAARLLPDHPLAHQNLGVALRRLGKVEAAIASYRRALALSPDEAGLNSNLGNALREAGRLGEAEFYLRKAHGIDPNSASFAYNLALVLRDCRRHDEARAMLTALVAAHPDNAEMAWDLALTHLYLRDYGKGFQGYEARWGLGRVPRRILAGSRWQPGQEVNGKTVLITAEQGFGDALQFARFLPMVAERGARLVVECLPELMDLFAAIPGIVQVVAKEAPLPAYDLWAPMMSLAWLLGITWDNLPAPAAYLTPPRPLVPPLPRPAGSRLNVGLVWAGKTTPRDRSWPLEKLLPLMEDPRIAWWSLQLGNRQADLEQLGVGALMGDLSPRLGSFAHTAAAMAQLDLVVTIDTSACHLAAALGRPTWVLLRYVSDWRWQDEPEDCAWYPTMRLFRQPSPDDFDSPVKALAAALADMPHSRPHSTSL